MLIEVYFFGKGPGQGQIPGLLDHGPQIPDRTIDHSVKQQTYVENFSSRRRTNGRTDGRTTQRFQ
jgi:hypothetical protein